MELRLALVLSLAAAAAAQQPDPSFEGWWGARKRPLTAADYGRWERLGSPVLAADGRHLAYTISRVDGTAETRLHVLGETAEPKVFEQAGSPAFSRDGRFLALRIQPTEAEREKLQKSKKPVRNDLELVDLASGDSTEIEAVQSFAFSEDGKFLAMRRYAAKGASDRGADLVVRDLDAGIDTSFGNVGSYSWSDKGALLALTIDTDDDNGNGVQLYDPHRGRLSTLDSHDAKYTALGWREDHDDLAVLREIDHDENEDASHVVLCWHALGSEAPRASKFDHRDDPDFPDMRIVTFAGLRWSDDGRGLFFGVKEWQDKPKDWGKDAKAEPAVDVAEASTRSDRPERSKRSKTPKSLRETLKEPAGVEVWHPNDIDIIPRQKRMLSQDQRVNFLAAWWIDSEQFVQLGDDLTEQVTLVERQQHAIGRDNTPYETEKRFGPTLVDAYLIDTKTGEKARLLDRQKFILGSSPGGRFVAYVKNDHVWTFEIGSGEHRNLTDGQRTSFINADRGVLTDENPAYGVAGWSEDGEHLFAYDRYDLWRFRSDGSEAVRLTRGAEHKVRHRRVVLDREEDEHIDPERPIYLSLYGDRDKQSGYARIDPNGAFTRLVWLDKSVGRLTKARDAEVYAFVSEAFDDSPDVFVCDATFHEPRQVSNTNPFQDEFAWGKAELVDYRSDRGAELQGGLYYPAGWQPGKQYPMITYIYELRSQQLHRYSVPVETNGYNPAVFTAQGYFVFQPDIVYRPQNPGLSALECVVPAVKKVLETGLVDPKRVGMVGHSWGAYQTAFLVTHSDVFAAGVAGAPLTNMMSMSLSIYWNTGQTDTWIFHESQGRMDRPFWRDMDTYVANSPLFGIDDLKTPLLIAFGDEDGAVDWQQGIELFNAARLVQKPVVMLVYPGENHGLRKKPNQVDYHYRILEWFGHYLKGDEAATWIESGKPHVERVRELDLRKRKNQRGSKAGASAGVGTAGENGRR